MYGLKDKVRGGWAGEKRLRRRNGRSCRRSRMEVEDTVDVGVE